MKLVVLLVALYCHLARAQDLSPSLRTINADLFTVGQPLEGFLSFSIEFSSFPDYAGNQSNPNEFSNNLLNNLGYLQGTNPYIRVGGNTQDYAIFNPDLQIALNGTYNVTRSPNYPTTVEIGPSFFESYTTWPNVKFSHGFNQGGNNDTRQWETLLATVPLACEAIGKDRLYVWEYGNEADLFATSSQGPVRPADYNETDYLTEWITGTAAIRNVLAASCPELISDDSYGYMAPSFAGGNNGLGTSLVWADGLNQDGNIKFYSAHSYIDNAESPNVRLQGTLLNHTRTRQTADVRVSEYSSIFPPNASSSTPPPPLILGEANSLYNQGAPGLSSSFGAALWGIDFNLYSASVGIRRVHMHQGSGFLYSSWQPVTTPRDTLGTKAPYYGNIVVAAFLGNLRIQAVSVANLPLSGNDTSRSVLLGSGSDESRQGGDESEQEAAYAAYVDNSLARILILNMRAYNSTINGTGLVPDPNAPDRPNRGYSFAVGLPEGMDVGVRRLVANGSDAITGITWDGLSYNYELNLGKPVRLANVTTGETVKVATGGVVEVGVLDSQAVILDFDLP